MKRRTKDNWAVGLSALFIAAVLALIGFSVYLQVAGDCSTFKHNQAKNIPARCLKEFTK